MAHIDVIEYDEAGEELKAIYDGLIQSRGKLAEVHKIQSLHPQSIIDHMSLYQTVMFGKSPLKRAVREMMAVVVSKANNCAYCAVHHGSALNAYWKDDDKIEALKTDFNSLPLSPLEHALCVLAHQTTVHPGGDLTEIHKTLRKEGLTDRGLLDANLVIGYFNFVNRLVLGLGVHLEDDQGEGYKY